MLVLILIIFIKFKIFFPTADVDIIDWSKTEGEKAHGSLLVEGNRMNKSLDDIESKSFYLNVFRVNRVNPISTSD